MTTAVLRGAQKFEKVQFGEVALFASRGLKSIFFEIFSNGAAQKRSPAMRSEARNLKKR